MLCHSLGGAIIVISLEHFIAPALDLMACLPSRQSREAIKVLLESDIIRGMLGSHAM